MIKGPLALTCSVADSGLPGMGNTEMMYSRPGTPVIPVRPAASVRCGWDARKRDGRTVVQP